MHTFSIFIFLALVLGALNVFSEIIKYKRKNIKKLKWKNYEECTRVLTATELEFYNTLKKVVKKNEIILCKVRQADLVIPTVKVGHHMFWTLFNRISKRHVDFVLCDPTTSRPIKVIELNDKSHFENSRMKRDQELREALQWTSIRLIEIPAQYQYEPLEIERIIYSGEIGNEIDKREAMVQKPKGIQNKAFSQPFRPQSGDKHIHGDKGIKEQLKKQEDNYQNQKKTPDCQSIPKEHLKYLPKP